MTSLGKLKLEFNNDAMKLKKFVLQAKTHIINNLAKKSKKIKSHKGNDETKAKFDKKAESLISEIFILKKIKYNDLVRFAMTNNIELSKVMNTPTVSSDKVMAKLISHKTLKSKIEAIKDKYKDIPFSELLEPNARKAKKKLIKEKRAIKNKKDKVSSVLSNEKDLEISKTEENCSDDESDNLQSDNEYVEDDITERINHSNKVTVAESDESMSDDNEFGTEFQKSNLVQTTSDGFLVTALTHEEKIGSQIKSKNSLVSKKKNNDFSATKDEKNRILIDLDDVPSSVGIEKTVDSFFVTESGDNYMTMALPRPPDDLQKFEERKSDFNQGNRKMRRAAQFGNDRPFRNKKQKPNLKAMDETRFSKKNFNKDDFSKKEKIINQKNTNISFDIKDKTSEPIEKLHPSWEAKKQLSTIMNFQGKKTVFAE